MGLCLLPTCSSYRPVWVLSPMRSLKGSDNMVWWEKPLNSAMWQQIDNIKQEAAAGNETAKELLEKMIRAGSLDALTRGTSRMEAVNDDAGFWDNIVLPGTGIRVGWVPDLPGLPDGADIRQWLNRNAHIPTDWPDFPGWPDMPGLPNLPNLGGEGGVIDTFINPFSTVYGDIKRFGTYGLIAVAGLAALLILKKK